MKSLSTYVLEQLEPQDMLVTEGKFWDWLKSLFTGSGKKYKNSYDEWVKSSDGAKKMSDTKSKLNKEFNEKTKEIFKNISDDSKPEDIKKGVDKFKELIKKKYEVIQKIKTDNQETLNDMPKDAYTATCMTATGDIIEDLQKWTKWFLFDVKAYKANISDNDKLLKQIEQSLMEYVASAKNSVELFNSNTYNDEKTDDKVKDEMINIIKNGKGTDKYFNISNSDISLNEKTYEEKLKEETNKILKK